MNYKINLVLLFACLLNACREQTEKEPDQPATAAAITSITYTTVQVYPHDTNAFTEGLLMHDNKLFESTGATETLPQTRSLFGILNTQNGRIETKAEIDRSIYFGEGIAFLNGKVFQLTYKNKIGFIYDAATFKQCGKFAIPSAEGWGLTTDGQYLIMSDGSNVLSYLDSTSLKVVKTLRVTENGYAKDQLNELEYIRGSIYANIWPGNTIVKINPADGTVTGVLDLSDLEAEAKQLHAASQEMNGIAYDAAKDVIFITGKMWPRLYELKISH